MKLDERVSERLIATHTRFPPVSVFLALQLVCTKLDDHPAIEEALVNLFTSIFRYIPPTYLISIEELVEQHKRWREERHTQPSVPLQDILTSPGNAINHVMACFCYNDALRQDGLLHDLRKQILENEADAHGLSVYERQRKKIPMAWEHDEPADELVKMYLRGTPFLEFFTTSIPFKIPRKTFASHCIVLAPPNHGKTQLLSAIIAEKLYEPDGPGIFVLDPHGDLFNVLRTRVEPSRLLVLDPDTSPPALNFLDFGASTEAQTLQTFSYLMSSLSGGLSDKQGAIVPYLLKLLRAIRGASLETLRTIVDEKVKRPDKSAFWSTIQTLPDVDQGFFHNQFYNSRMQETKDAIGWKLYSALSSDAFRQMFSPPSTSDLQGFDTKRRNSTHFDADAAMRERKVVLVKGARGVLGDDGMKVFLQFIVAQFFAAALRRERIHPRDRHLCLMFVDEAHHVFNSQTANILTECRKYGLGMVSATQVVQQIPDDVKAAIYGATAIKICGPVSHNDATVLSREMYCTTEFIRSMKAKEASHADWAFYVTGMTERAIKVTVPYGSLEELPKIPQIPPIRKLPITPMKPIPNIPPIPPIPKDPKPKPKGDAPQTHNASAVSAEALRGKEIQPAEADTTIIANDDDIPTSAPGGWKTS